MQNGFIQQKEMKIVQLNEQFESKCRELAECHDTNTKQVQELHQQAAQIIAFKRDFDQLFENLKTEETLNCNLTAKINAMELQVGDLERKLSAAEDRSRILITENQNFQLEIQKLISLGSNNDGKLQDCNNKYQAIMLQLDQCRRDLVNEQHTSQRKAQEFQQELNTLTGRMNDELSGMNKKLQDANNARLVCEQKYEAAERNAKQVQDGLQMQLQQTVQMCKQKEDVWIKTEQRYKIDIANLQGELVKNQQEFQSQIGMCQQNNGQLKQEMKDLQVLLKQKSDMIVEMESKCKQMYAECQGQCQHMQQECSLEVKKCNDMNANLRTTLQSRDQQINEISMQLNTVRLNFSWNISSQSPYIRDSGQAGTGK